MGATIGPPVGRDPRFETFDLFMSAIDVLAQNEAVIAAALRVCAARQVHHNGRGGGDSADETSGDVSTEDDAAAAAANAAAPWALAECLPVWSRRGRAAAAGATPTLAARDARRVVRALPADGTHGFSRSLSGAMASPLSVVTAVVLVVMPMTTARVQKGLRW